jgi:hypothetical protein
MALFGRRHHTTSSGTGGRFYLAVLLTIVAVAYLAVPWLARLIDAAREYSPSYYEPKDFTRQEYILRHGLPPASFTLRDIVIDVGLVLAVVVAWITVLSRGGTRR